MDSEEEGILHIRKYLLHMVTTQKRGGGQRKIRIPPNDNNRKKSKEKTMETQSQQKTEIK